MKKNNSVHIIYQNEDIAAFYKPYGLLTSPDRWNRQLPNLMDIVHKEFSSQWFNAHRLDADTSGIILCAKNKDSLMKICRQFEEKTIEKEYVAIVNGCPPQNNGRIDLKIIKHEHTGKVSVSSKEGSESSTVYSVVTIWENYSLVIAKPLTGRLHQIRAHFSAAGFPVVCDSIYGKVQRIYLSSLKRNYKRTTKKESPLIERLALHAYSLSFINPSDGQIIKITAPLPSDMQLTIKYLNKFAHPRNIINCFFT